jgi:hypothetical protein
MLYGLLPGVSCARVCLARTLSLRNLANQQGQHQYVQNPFHLSNSRSPFILSGTHILLYLKAPQRYAFFSNYASSVHDF